VILRTPTGGQVAISRRDAVFPEISPRARRYMGGSPFSASGEFTLPTLAQAIRLCAVSVAQAKPYVVDLSDPAVPVPKTRGVLPGLFSYQSGPFNAFDFFSDISSNVDGFGNAFVQKLKYRGRVVELRLVDPNRVQVRRNADGEKVFDVVMETGETLRDQTDEDILHIRGWTPNGALSGLSLVQSFRRSIGNMADAQEFVGSFFRQGSVVPYALKVPGEVDPNEAEEILAVWESTHGGVTNMHRPGLLSNGAEIEKLGMSLADAEFVSNQKWTVEEGARMANCPPELLQPSNADTAPTEQVLLKFLTLYIRPRCERILAAINADLDLFGSSRTALEFDYSELREADLASQGTFLLRMRQSGIMTQNESRARIGLPPRDGGDELLAIPVGAPGADKQGDPATGDGGAAINE